MSLGPIEIGQWAIVLPPIPFLIMAAAMIGLYYLIVIHPMVRIIQRTGHSGWTILWLFVPIANVIALNVLAYGRWPALDGNKNSN